METMVKRIVRLGLEHFNNKFVDEKIMKQVARKIHKTYDTGDITDSDLVELIDFQLYIIFDMAHQGVK